MDLRKYKISIGVTAYKSNSFIKECLKSIQDQSFFKDNDNYEILLGIDDCTQTLNRVNQIRLGIKNLKVFMMDENQGTYITSNTLIYQATGDYYLRFDSDDIMLSDMIEKLIDIAINKNYNFVYSKFLNLENNKLSRPNRYIDGIVFANLNVLKNTFGGYEGWRIGADSELVQRIKKSTEQIGYLPYEVFVRRIHKNSLTKNKETGFDSPIRKEYQKRAYNNSKNNIFYIKPKTNKFKEV